jgi:spermidine synthase
MRSRCIYREENAETHLEIWDEGERRSLWFDDVILQSEIHIQDPAVLPNPVNRAMLAHLMFDPPLERVLLAGCGGGAIARWFNARVPEVAGDAVELSSTVARLAREYFDFPRPESRWRLLLGDVRQHLLHCEQRYDFILVDLEENQQTPEWVTGEEFLRSCQARLSAGGTLTLNLITGLERETAAALQRVRQVFSAGLDLLHDPGHDNLLVLASRPGPPQRPDHATLERRGRHWGLDFTTMAQRLRRLGPNAAP